MCSRALSTAVRRFFNCRRSIRLSLAVAVAVVLATPAGATTFDPSVLNATHFSGRPSFNACPCYDPVTGTQIFGSGNGQTNPWTVGTDGSAATINFFGGSQGNNSGKMYVPSGAPQFPLPTSGTETQLGNNNTQGSGDYAQSFIGPYPLYFWFSIAGNANVTAPVNDLDSLYLADAPATLTILGYNGLANQGGTLIPGDVYTIGTAISFTPQKITLPSNWTNISAIYIVDSASGTCFGGHACDTTFYVNDIEVNDAPATPLPAGLPLFATGIGGLGLLGWRRKRKEAAIAA